MTKGQKIILFSLVAVFLILIVGTTYFLSSGKVKVEWSGDKEKASGPSEEIRKKQSEEAAQETQKLIDEVEEIASSSETEEEEEESEISYAYRKRVTIPNDSEGEGSTTSEEKVGVVVAPGSSAIEKETGDVVTKNGEKTKNDVKPGSEEAPQQSFAVDKEELPESVKKITMYQDNIEPAEFRVKAGQAASLAITAGDSYTHIFRFDDESLRAVAVGLSPGETRTITFNVPEEKGEYIYYSDMANFRKNGAEGKMIVE